MRVLDVANSFRPLRLILAWGARGPEFRSRRSDQSKRAILEAAVVKSVAGFKKRSALGGQWDGASANQESARDYRLSNIVKSDRPRRA